MPNYLKKMNRYLSHQLTITVGVSLGNEISFDYFVVNMNQAFETWLFYVVFVEICNLADEGLEVFKT